MSGSRSTCAVQIEEAAHGARVGSVGIDAESCSE